MPPTATPTPSPSATQGATETASPSPSPAAEASPGSAFSTTITPAEEAPGTEGEPTAEVTPKPQGTGTQTGPSAEGDAGSTPPVETSNVAPLDIGAVKPQLRVSDAPLTAMILQAPTPSMAASLRIADQARKKILANRPDDAIQLLTHALSVDPGDWYAYFYLGRAWLMKRDYAQAMTFFKRAELGFSSNPEWLGETLAFEGLTYEESGQTAAAAQAYQMAVRAEPGNLMARVGYTRLAVQTAGMPAVGPPTTSEVAPPPQESAAPPPPAAPPPAN